MAISRKRDVIFRLLNNFRIDTSKLIVHNCKVRDARDFEPVMCTILFANRHSEYVALVEL